MRKQDVGQLHKESLDSLKTKLVDLKKGLFVAYNDKIQNKEKNVHVINGKKKDIARVLTVLRTKELGL